MNGRDDRRGTHRNGHCVAIRVERNASRIRFAHRRTRNREQGTENPVERDGDATAGQLPELLEPPSSDGLGKAPPRSLRRPSHRKPGGQPGHEGTTLDQVAEPDQIIRHEPAGCGRCGSDLVDAKQVDCSRRQVFDIPPITVRVVEHQVITRRCACGRICKGDPPAGVLAATQYGPKALAIIVYLFMGQFLSKKRTAIALSELFGTPVSSGTVATATARAAADLDQFISQVTAQLIASPVVNFDETGLRSNGRLTWLHSASTDTFSLLFSHRRRGVAAMNDMAVLPTFTGVAVHDAWAPYDTLRMTTPSGPTVLV